jgi:hypothetical protein
LVFAEAGEQFVECPYKEGVGKEYGRQGVVLAETAKEEDIENGDKEGGCFGEFEAVGYIA